MRVISNDILSSETLRTRYVLEQLREHRIVFERGFLNGKRYINIYLYYKDSYHSTKFFTYRIQVKGFLKYVNTTDIVGTYSTPQSKIFADNFLNTKIKIDKELIK
jgi:hypothetical protein